MWIRVALFLLSWIPHFLFDNTIHSQPSKSGDTTSNHKSISPADSLKRSRNTTFLATLATSFTENKNWQNVDYRNYFFLGNIDYSLRVSSDKFKQLYQVRGELGFLKFIDSTWFKNSDNFNILTQWTEYSTKAITHSYSIILKTQFTDTWKYNSDINGETTREWRGGILNPATLMIAYGLNYDFWERCFINLALATIKVSTRPRYDNELLPTEKELARTAKSFIISEYGMSIQSAITKKISGNVSWDNKTLFFTNGINKNQITWDFQNRFTFVSLKYLQLRADTHIVYDPQYSYRFQYKQELLIGLFYERKK